MLYVAHLCLSLCLSLCLKLGAKAGQCHVLVYTFVVVVINKQLIETDANIIAPNIGYTLELLLDLQLSIFVRRNVALVSNM